MIDKTNNLIHSLEGKVEKVFHKVKGQGNKDMRKRWSRMSMFCE